MKTRTLTVIACLVAFTIQAQNLIENYSFGVNDLNSNQFAQFFSKKIKNTQFIMLGEQHGIQEVGEITNALYNLSKPEGYNALCIETSPFAANILELQFTSAKNPAEGLKKLYDAYPFAIPFYNNKNDIGLFKNVIENHGAIWGIDQSFMVEYRLVFDYLVNLNDNKALKNTVKPLLKEANLAFNKAVEKKDYQALFIFKYTDELHHKLMALTISDEEKKILTDLKLTKEIYLYNFQQQYYLNNNERAKLMKRNFLTYYDEAATAGKLPKVIFKLGANHVAKGFTPTNVLDISNMITELAAMNGKTSLHVYAVGINGAKNLGNPFAPTPVVPFDDSENIPEEVKNLIKNITANYIIIDAEKLKEKANRLSPKMKKLVLQYDVLMYVNACKPLENLD
ncbi:hypothetical protein [uncultured Kordia sp.]|uniref:hypothetical protein n=1 Tax=uncultured Kordia sp. TaxID=507699 RepID=UPI0026051EC5|nr:hypothetical protein [uncultured Kordia sp.]